MDTKALKNFKVSINIIGHKTQHNNYSELILNESNPTLSYQIHIKGKFY